MRNFNKWIHAGAKQINKRFDLKDSEADALYKGYFGRGFSFDKAIGAIYGVFYFGFAVGMQQAKSDKEERILNTMGTKTETLKAIKGCMKEAQEAYNKYAALSWDNKVNNLKPGEAVPDKGRIYDDENKKAYNEKLAELKASALTIANGYLNALNKASAAAPSEEGLRAVQMFALADPGTMSKTEYANRIKDMIAQYGNNCVTYETLRSIAIKNGVHEFDPHPLQAEKDDAHAIVQNTAAFFTKHILAGSTYDKGISDGELAFYDMFLTGVEAESE